MYFGKHQAQMYTFQCIIWQKIFLTTTVLCQESQQFTCFRQIWTPNNEAKKINTKLISNNSINLIK